jgi:hypothetical protein
MSTPRAVYSGSRDDAGQLRDVLAREDGATAGESEGAHEASHRYPKGPRAVRAPLGKLFWLVHNIEKLAHDGYAA